MRKISFILLNTLKQAIWVEFLSYFVGLLEQISENLKVTRFCMRLAIKCFQCDIEEI